MVVCPLRLTCHTDLTTCCRSDAENNGQGGLGQYPDGSVLLNKNVSVLYGLLQYTTKILKLLCLGAYAQARYTVVCLCVCVDCYSCSRINEVQVRVSIGFYSHVFLDSYLWICKIKLRSRVMPSFAYLECHCSLFRRVRSKLKLVYQVMLLVSSALER